MYPPFVLTSPTQAADVFVDYAVGCRHGQLEVKSALAYPQASKKGKKQSTSNCLRMLAMQDNALLLWIRTMRLPIFPCSYVPHHRPKLEQLETFNPGVQQQISKESRVDQGGAKAPKLQQPLSSLQPSSFCCLPCLHTGPLVK